MKKKLGLFIFSLMILIVSLVFCAGAASVSDLEYDISNNQVTITDCDEYASGTLEIPEKIKGYPVVAIDDNAMWFCEDLTCVVLPSTVRTIGYKAFAYCEYLFTIYIPAGVTSLDSNAFYGCDMLESIYFGGSQEDWDAFECDISEETTVLCGHSHTYKNTVKRATLTANGEINGVCDCGATKKTVLYAVTNIKLSATEYLYTGKAITPGITVKNSKNASLSTGSYSVSYIGDRTKPGECTVRVTLKGNYSGAKDLKFKIYSKTNTLKLNSTSVSVGINQEYTLKATVSPKTAKQTVSYQSSNTKIATVSSSGVIKGRAKGKATVTVKTFDGKTTKCTVNVIDAKLNTSSKTLNVGQKYTLSVVGSKQSVKKWYTGNSKIVTVSSAGVLTAKAQGQTTVTAKLNSGISLKCTVKVTKASLNATSISVYKYNTKQLKLNNAASSVKWSSNNTKIAKVNSKGVVTGVSKGSAVVTATCAGVKYNCKVTVKNQNPITVTKVDWYINSADGVEPMITIRNNTNKDIKYIKLETEYRNRFGDPAYCEITGYYKVNLNVQSGLMAKQTRTFYWDPAVYNSQVSRLDINKVYVTFVDNTTATVNVNCYWYDRNYYYQ